MLSQQKNVRRTNGRESECHDTVKRVYKDSTSRRLPREEEQFRPKNTSVEALHRTLKYYH